MKSWISSPVLAGLLTGSVLFASFGSVAPGGVKLNAGALKYARELITAGHTVDDKHGSWSEHQPSTQAENEFMDRHSIEEYAQWYLGVDESHREDSKAHYKFPYGDFRNVHRCALIALISRARQHGYFEIETAARELLALMEQSDHGNRRSLSSAEAR